MSEEAPDLKASWLRQCVSDSAEALQRGTRLPDLVAALRAAEPPHSEDQIRTLLAHLWQRADLSEGQAAKVLGIGRVEFRKVCDDLGLSQWTTDPLA